jgi:hypothetical protein
MCLGYVMVCREGAFDVAEYSFLRVNEHAE